MFYIMKIHLLLALCIVWIRTEKVYAGVENEVKRGTVPFMALLYYPDESIVDSTGARFQRGAVLLSPQWLVSAAIDHAMMDNMPLGFPVKTLLARLGAITLDSNYTLNEDEEEQEREVIQIVRPNNHKVDTWWLTDITLLKTLLAFTETPAIAPIPSPVNINQINMNATDCRILVFTKKARSDDKVLMQMTVDLLPPSTDNCGAQFSETNMACAFDSEETKREKYDSEFCIGNAGGPLMCEGNVVGLQTYIENICKPPHLYQLLSPWEKMISCAMLEHCAMESGCNICTVSYKDSPQTTATSSVTSSDSSSDSSNDTISDPTGDTISDTSRVTLPVAESPLTTTEMATVTTDESESVHASSSTLDTTIPENDSMSSQTEETTEEKTEDKTEDKTEEKTEEISEERIDHESSSAESIPAIAEVTSEFQTTFIMLEDNETNASEITKSSFDITTISTKVDESSSTATTTETTTASMTTTATTMEGNIMFMPGSLNHSFNSIFFSESRAKSDTEENTSRDNKVNVEAQQKPPSEQANPNIKREGSNSPNLINSRCVLLVLLLLAYFVN